MNNLKTARYVGKHWFKSIFCKVMLKKNKKRQKSTIKDDFNETVEKITILNSDKTLEIKKMPKTDEVKIVRMTEESTKV